jgi:hypothetical protein
MDMNVDKDAETNSAIDCLIQAGVMKVCGVSEARGGSVEQMTLNGPLMEALETIMAELADGADVINLKEEDDVHTIRQAMFDAIFYAAVLGVTIGRRDAMKKAGA